MGWLPYPRKRWLAVAWKDTLAKASAFGFALIVVFAAAVVALVFGYIDGLHGLGAVVATTVVVLLGVASFASAFVGLAAVIWSWRTGLAVGEKAPAAPVVTEVHAAPFVSAPVETSQAATAPPLPPEQPIGQTSRGGLPGLFRKRWIENPVVDALAKRFVIWVGTPFVFFLVAIPLNVLLLAVGEEGVGHVTVLILMMLAGLCFVIASIFNFVMLIVSPLRAHRTGRHLWQPGAAASLR